MALPCEMLLHPELLTNEQLISVIQERHLRVPNMYNMSRDELLNLFHNFCVPYGQRKYRDSGRGKVLNKTRQLSPESSPKLNTMNNTQSRKISRNCDRLKPPPDLLSGHIKRIKLENKALPINKDTNNTKRKLQIPIDCATPTLEGPPAKREKKAITWP